MDVASVISIDAAGVPAFGRTNINALTVSEDKAAIVSGAAAYLCLCGMRQEAYRDKEQE